MNPRSWLVTTHCTKRLAERLQTPPTERPPRTVSVTLERKMWKASDATASCSIVFPLNILRTTSLPLWRPCLFPDCVCANSKDMHIFCANWVPFFSDLPEIDQLTSSHTISSMFLASFGRVSVDLHVIMTKSCKSRRALSSDLYSTSSCHHFHSLSIATIIDPWNELISHTREWGEEVIYRENAHVLDV
jgi:hypothetical protein